MPESRLERGLIIPPTHVELIACDHCNITCRNCNHASPGLPKWSADPDAVRRDLGGLAKVYRPPRLKIIGGEPLLHPSLAALTRAARSTRISDYFLLVTNGMFLDRMDDEVWKLIDEVEVSTYPGVDATGATSELIREKARHFRTTLTINRYEQFRATFSTAGTDDMELVKRVYAACKIAHVWGCHVVREGYLYKCPQSIYVPMLTGQSFESDRLKIEAGADFQVRLLEFVNSPEPLASCTFCVGTSGKKQAHGLLPRRDWLAHLDKPLEELVDCDYLAGSLGQHGQLDNCKDTIETVRKRSFRGEVRLRRLLGKLLPGRF